MNGGNNVPNLCGNRVVHLPVKQDAARIAQQPPGPAGNKNRTDYSHNRIKPVPSKKHPADKCHDCKHGGSGVGNDVQIGRSQVQIVVMVMDFVVVMRMIVMLFSAAKNVGTSDIDDQTDDRYRDGLRKVNCLGGKNALDGGEYHHRSDSE